MGIAVGFRPATFIKWNNYELTHDRRVVFQSISFNGLVITFNVFKRDGI